MNSGASESKLEAWRTVDGWRTAGIPEQIIMYVTGRRRSNSAGDPVRARIERFARFYFDNQDAADKKIVSKAWGRIQKAVKGDEELIKFFATLPDKPDRQPFRNIHGSRNIDWEEESRRYAVYAAHAKALSAFLITRWDTGDSRPNLEDLLHDAVATGAEAAASAERLRNEMAQLKVGLEALRETLRLVDAKAKYLTAQPLSPNADKQTFVRQLALLYGYFREGQCPHQAVSDLAFINCPAYRVPVKTLASVLARSA